MLPELLVQWFFATIAKDGIDSSFTFVTVGGYLWADCLDRERHQGANLYGLQDNGQNRDSRRPRC